MPRREIQLATLCYLKKRGYTLMLHRVTREQDVHKDKWNGLGGKFHPGETPEDCVKREVQEECGLRIKNPILRGILTFPLFTPHKDWVVFLFTAHRFSGKLKQTEEGHLHWIKDQNLKRLKLWKGDILFLHWLARDKFFSAKFVYKNKKLTNYKVVFY